MNKIETKILNCFAIKEAEKNMVFAARLTQRGHIIHSMNDLVDLYNQSFTNETLTHLGELPHPAIQKFTVITLAVVGASRRFLHPDHPAPERSKVHECIITVQQLFRRSRFCHSI